MTQTEALRLALDALTDALNKPMWNRVQMEAAITAGEAALEAKDEPVACKECHLKNTVYDLLGDLKVANLKLSVRSQRTWVGLTAEEREQVQAESYGKVPHHVALIAAIEAKLKEKNT